jgi:hypothetical protein
MTDGNILFLVFIVATAATFMLVLGWAEKRTRQ